MKEGNYILPRGDGFVKATHHWNPKGLAGCLRECEEEGHEPLFMPDLVRLRISAARRGDFPPLNTQSPRKIGRENIAS